jgi:hypothetical protein
MDPNATLQHIKDAEADGDKSTARWLRKELKDWVRDGGFEPSDPNWRNV